jgi:hypothetical protein
MLWWARIGVTAWFLNSCGHKGMSTLETQSYSWRPVAFTKHLSSLHPSFPCPCPGWKMQTQILYKAVLARSCPIYLISLTHLPNPGLSLVQSRVRLSPDGCNLFGWNELTCPAPEVEPSQATGRSLEQVFWGTACWDENMGGLVGLVVPGKGLILRKTVASSSSEPQPLSLFPNPLAAESKLFRS